MPFTLSSGDVSKILCSIGIALVYTSLLILVVLRVRCEITGVVFSHQFGLLAFTFFSSCLKLRVFSVANADKILLLELQITTLFDFNIWSRCHAEASSFCFIILLALNLELRWFSKPCVLLSFIHFLFGLILFKIFVYLLLFLFKSILQVFILISFSFLTQLDLCFALSQRLTWVLRRSRI